MSKPTRLLFSWFLLAMLVGCLSTPKEEEEEVHFPPHWPVTVFAASDRLKQISGTDSSIESKAPSVERELVDLITWLPELVADSDMTKEEFDQIDGWATKLASEGEILLGKGAKLAELMRMEGLQQSLLELHEMCDRNAAKKTDDEAKGDVQ